MLPVLVFIRENILGRWERQAQFSPMRMTLPHVPHWAFPVWHIFTVRSPERDRLQEYLKEKGTGSLIHYPVPLHLAKAYQEAGFLKGAFPTSESIAAGELSLPIGHHMDLDDAGYVVHMIQEYLSRR